MNWNSDAVSKVLRDAGYEFIEASYKDTDDEGCDRYSVFIRSLTVQDEED